jgi:hypothetical protein
MCHYLIDIAIIRHNYGLRMDQCFAYLETFNQQPAPTNPYTFRLAPLSAWESLRKKITKS